MAQAEALLQSTIAQQQNFERARADQEHALAIVCGQPAPTFSVAANPLHEIPPPDIPAGLPAMLLTRRPDVAATEQAVVAANAQVGVAMAAFYPRFSRAAFAGFESANLRTLIEWKSGVASIMAGVVQPIFEGGRLKATLAATRAQYQQTVVTYLNQVLIAYADVEDALPALASVKLALRRAGVRRIITGSSVTKEASSTAHRSIFNERNALVEHLCIASRRCSVARRLPPEGLSDRRR